MFGTLRNIEKVLVAVGGMCNVATIGYALYVDKRERENNDVVNENNTRLVNELAKVNNRLDDTAVLIAKMEEQIKGIDDIENNVEILNDEYRKLIKRVIKCETDIFNVRSINQRLSEIEKVFNEAEKENLDVNIEIVNNDNGNTGKKENDTAVKSDAVKKNNKKK